MTGPRRTDKAATHVDGVRPVYTSPTDNSGDDRQPGNTVQSVDRALQILELIGRSGSAGVSELAMQLGVHKSTVSRLVASLETRGFVEQVPGGREYRIGFTVVRLAGTTAAKLDLNKYGQDICNQVAAATGETTNLVVRSGDQAINVVEALGTASVAMHTWIGQATPAHATSSGKVLLSALTAAQLCDLLPARLPVHTANTVTARGELLDELALVAERGWAVADEELEVGMVAIAVPVRDHTGDIVAALSISGPRYRLDLADAPTIAAGLAESVAELNARFGYTGT